VFYNATQSFAASDIMVTVLIFNLAASTVGALAAASRQLWSFARNNGVPFSRFFAPVSSILLQFHASAYVFIQGHLSHDIPLHAIFVSLTIAIILALINIGSSEVLSILLSIYNSALIASYAITISCVLLHRLQGRRLPEHARYSLGKWGPLINICALIYITPLFIFSFFPSTPNPKPDTMNWACLMVGGVILLATVYYIIWGRKTYSPPNETIEDYIERNVATTSVEKVVSDGITEERVEAGKSSM
jgi:amino acid transporter